MPESKEEWFIMDGFDSQKGYGDFVNMYEGNRKDPVHDCDIPISSARREYEEGSQGRSFNIADPDADDLDPKMRQLQRQVQYEAEQASKEE